MKKILLCLGIGIIINSCEIVTNHYQCAAITQKGTQCKRIITKGIYCWQHQR